MDTTLDLAMAKLATLPREAQGEIARDLLAQIDGWSQLGAALDVGLAELDAVLGAPLDLEENLRRLQSERALR